MEKLFDLQRKIKPILKDSENPFFQSKYFDINKLIEHLKPILEELGLSITQPLEILDGKNTLSTILWDTTEQKKLCESYVLLPDNIDPQKMGSAITYFRRYAIQSMLFLQAEDDDAESTKDNNTNPTNPRI